MMNGREMDAILAELAKMDPGILDEDYDQQYERCRKVYNALDDWSDYTLVEMVDAQTFEKKFFWRRKA